MSESIDIASLAAGCQRFVQVALGVELDGTPDTLPILDHYLRTLDVSGPASAPVTELVATSAGAYFGEVVRNALTGARWCIPDPAVPDGWRVELDHVFLAFHPVALVLAAMEDPGETGPEGWNASISVRREDLGVVTQSLEHVGGVNEEDFNRLAVRWEVLEQVVQVLQAAMLAKGSEEHFSPEAYRAILDTESAPVM